MSDYFHESIITKMANGVGFSSGYGQGRADAEKEHEKICETCIHKVSSDDIKAIRANAIDEYKEQIIDEMNKFFAEKIDKLETDIDRIDEYYKEFNELMRMNKELCERINPIKECKSCEYCNLFENKCFITDEFCYENKKCKHENCDNYIKGKWQPQMC